MTTWFCDAYASWQKGEVENANGRSLKNLAKTCKSASIDPLPGLAPKSTGPALAQSILGCKKTAALIKWPEGLVRRNGLQQLEVIPGIFRLGSFLTS